MKFPVTLQFVVQVADGSVWLYERHVELNVPPYTGLALKGFCPNVTGPKANLDNIVRLVVDSPDETFVKIQGVTEASLDVAEMDTRIPDWKRCPEPLLPSTAVRLASDQIDQLFN